MLFTPWFNLISFVSVFLKSFALYFLWHKIFFVKPKLTLLLLNYFLGEKSLLVKKSLLFHFWWNKIFFFWFIFKGFCSVKRITVEEKFFGEKNDFLWKYFFSATSFCDNKFGISLFCGENLVFMRKKHVFINFFILNYMFVNHVFFKFFIKRMFRHCHYTAVTTFTTVTTINVNYKGNFSQKW